MKNKAIIIVSWVLVLAAMLMIFNFSSETGEVSTQTSAGVVVEVLDVFMEKEDITPEVVQKYQFPIRKLAHFGIYMLLGFCLMNAVEKSFRFKVYISIAMSFVLSFVYACSDEFHQSYTESRGPSFIDVLIDSSGALVGIFVFILFIWLINKFLKRKSRT